MAKFYKLIEVAPMGEPWESHGNQIQTWWCKVEGESLGVSIGKKVGNTLRVGEHVYGDLLKAVSGKGNEFWKFKGSQVPEGMERPVSNNSGGDFSGSASGIASQAGEILTLLRDNNRRLKILMGEEEIKEEPEIADDKQIDLGDIPF
jgi:hypothetical protein